MLENIISSVVGVIIGFCFTFFSKPRHQRLKKECEFVTSFAKQLETVGKSDPDADRKLRELWEIYSEQEQIIKIYGSNTLVNFVEEIRIKAGFEPNRPLFVMNGSSFYKNFTEEEWRKAIGIYFSESNYKKLLTIVRRDRTSIEFFLNLE